MLGGRYNAIESDILVVVFLVALNPCSAAEFLLDVDKSGSPVPALVPILCFAFAKI